MQFEKTEGNIVRKKNEQNNKKARQTDCRKTWIYRSVADWLLKQKAKLCSQSWCVNYLSKHCCSFCAGRSFFNDLSLSQTENQFLNNNSRTNVYK